MHEPLTTRTVATAARKALAALTALGLFAKRAKRKTVSTLTASFPSALKALLARAALSALSGALYYAAFPGVGWWPLGFVALTPLLIAAGCQPALRAALFGFLTGIVAVSAGYWWLLSTLYSGAGLSRPVSAIVFAVFVLWHAGRFAVFVLLIPLLQGRRLPWLGAVAAAFVTSETIYPVVFPWYLGATIHGVPLLTQTATVGGPVLVGLPLAVTSALIATWTKRLVERKNGTKRTKILQKRDKIALAVALGAPALFGAVTIPFVDERVASAPDIKLGIVQGNIAMPLVPATAHEVFTAQVNASKRLAAEGADLIVWPESAFIHVLCAADPSDIFGRTEAASVHAPMLVGATMQLDQTEAHSEMSGFGPKPAERGKSCPSTGKYLVNSAILFDSQGQVQGRYDKQHRVPFAEFSPLELPRPLLPRHTTSQGTSQYSLQSLKHIATTPYAGPIPFEDKRITALICYEDLLTGYVARTVRQQRPHLLVNLTNDGWFAHSHAAKMHHALAKLRAVEHRRFMLRATNTGVTSIIDPVGRESLRMPPWTRDKAVHPVKWLYTMTPYSHWGDLPWYIAAAITITSCLLRPKNKQKKCSASKQQKML